MDRKEKLKDMLNHIINDDTEKAKSAFHTYLKDKMQEVYKGKKD